VWIPPEISRKAQRVHELETANRCGGVRAAMRSCAWTRGHRKSPGKSEPSSYQEALDAYDVTEWIARQAWCSARSARWDFLSCAFQWRLANLQPPSLKAIMPWKGARTSIATKPITAASSRWALSLSGERHRGTSPAGKPRSYNPDAFNNNLLGSTCATILTRSTGAETAPVDRITVPLYSVGNWAVSRCTCVATRGYMLAASKHKKLRIHTGSHFHPFHSEVGRMDQLRWFDYWLKDLDTGIMDEPREAGNSHGGA